MALTFELMTRVETDTHVCRIWSEDMPSGGKSALVHIAKLALMELRDPVDLNNAVISIAEFKGVSAVEIINRATGDGLCVYKNWP